jgi:long-chain fatty acid transport protein
MEGNMNKVTKVTSGFALSLSFLLGMHAANAAGFYLKELGTPSSTGMAGVSNVTNNFTADAAWTNPAGMTGLSEDSFIVGATVLSGKVEFDSDVATGGGSDGGNALEPIFIPSLFYTRVLSEKSRFGLSLVASVGGGVDYGDNFVGRYAVQSIELSGLALTPSYAYQVNDQLSIGVGLSFLQSKLDQEVAINTLLVADDGKATFDDLDDEGYQGILGLTYQASKKTLIGVVYRSESSIELEGKLKVEGTAIPIANQDVKIEWDNPQTLEMGIQHRMTDAKTLFLNLGWQEWSAFSENKLSVKNTGIVDVTDRNWDDTWLAGVAYAQKLDGGETFKLGLAYESSPVKDKYRTFDFPVDEMWRMSAGYSWEGGNKFDYAIGATLTRVGEAAIDQSAQGVQAAGDFDKYLLLSVGGTLRYLF